MKIITGFIYYFLIAVMCLTLSLIVFAFRPFRRLLHKIQSKYRHILQNIVFTAIVYFSFAIIGIILMESVYSFLKIHAHLQTHDKIFEEQGLQSLDLIKGHHGHTIESTILTIKEYRQYYMSERNIMLTSSAFFAYFIFNKIFFNIRKLADIENQIEHPEDKTSLYDDNEDGKVKTQ